MAGVLAQRNLYGHAQDEGLTGADVGLLIYWVERFLIHLPEPTST